MCTIGSLPSFLTVPTMNIDLNAPSISLADERCADERGVEGESCESGDLLDGVRDGRGLKEGTHQDAVVIAELWRHVAPHSGVGGCTLPNAVALTY